RFAGADAHRLLDGNDEDLAVADLPGFGRRDDRINRPVDHRGRNHHLDLDLRQEVHGVFGAPINFRVALLPPVSLHLGHGHALQAELSEGLAHLIELEWLYDRHHQLHLSNPSMFTAAKCWPWPSSRANPKPESSRVPTP